MATTVIKQCICCGFIQYNFSSLMKHKTENTHKTHYKAAVRLQWRDSMAQHGRLVVSCTGTLHSITNTSNHISSLCQDPGGGGWVVGIINMTTGQTMTVGFQCMFLIDYSCSGLSDKVVKLHLDVHMHLAQG